MKNLTLNTASKGGGYYPYVDLSENSIVTFNDGYKTLVYKPENNVKIVNNQEYFKSIIIDGEERIISPDANGELVVKTLSNPRVKVKFKSGITSVSDCFANCSSLIEISENLFSDNPEILSFRFCFYSCSSLISIPENLFINNTKVTDFSICFYGCASLTFIPENLFVNNTEIKNFEHCMYKCTSLITIPERLFANNRKVTNFSYCLGRNNNLQTMPIDSDNTPIYNRSGEGKEGYSIVTDHDDCFIECTNIEGYDQIPIEWK